MQQLQNIVAVLRGVISWLYEHTFLPVVIDALKGFSEHEGPTQAGHLAFMSLLALFPFLVFLVSLAGMFGQSDAALQAIAFGLDQLPWEVARALEGPIDEVLRTADGGLAMIGLFGALWTAASGMQAATVSVNRAYGLLKERPLWRRRLESLAMILIAAVAISLSLILVVFGGVAWREVDDLIPLPDKLDALMFVWRYVLSGGVIFLSMLILYWTLPFRRLNIVTVIPGAFIIAGVWVGLGALFSMYLSEFGDMPKTYGSLGGVIVSLLFFYLVGALFIFGAEFNAAVQRRREARQKAAETPTEVPVS